LFGGIRNVALGACLVFVALVGQANIWLAKFGTHLEHLQQFANLHLVNLEIWQVAKTNGK
jgi:hypothetical protein